MMKRITTPLDNNQIKALKSGDEILLSGVIYTARDQAHKRLVEALRQGKKLPIDLKKAVIYYCGPTPAPKGKVIGSCGPTTSRRMDAFTPALLKAGLRAMIGKGDRADLVNEAIKKYKGVYFITHAGCGALLNKCVIKTKKVAYFELGPEAIHQLEVKDFPLFVEVV